MGDKPADRKYTRKGERDGAKLTPGERAIHWAKAAAIIIPLIGIGAIGDEPAKRWLGLTEPDGETELDPASGDFQKQVTKFSQEVREELTKIHDQVQRVNVQLAKKDQENYERLEGHLQELKAQVGDIQELVN